MRDGCLGVKLVMLLCWMVDCSMCWVVFGLLVLKSVYLFLKLIMVMLGFVCSYFVLLVDISL